MTDLARLERSGLVATLLINRPDQHNALSLELLDALAARLTELESDAPPVLVVTGSGRSFCAGMDLKQVLADTDTPRLLLESLARITVRLRALPSIVIASVNGAAIGGGCGLACVCDLAISHADAKLGFPEVDLGLCPAVVAPWVVRKIGAGPARRLLLEGGTISGARAHELGLIDHLAPDRDSLANLTGEVAERIASGGPLALAATKNLLNELDHSLDSTPVLRGAALSASVLATEDAQNALRARLK